MPPPDAHDVTTLLDLSGTSRDADVRDRVAAEFAGERLHLSVLRPDDPRAVLDQVIAGEQVHPIAGPDDLRRRLGPDRRILALVHRALPDRLLAFVEVALTPDLEVDMPAILTGPVIDPSDATTAIFYSINRCEPGLRGLGVPAILLDRAIPALREDVRTLTLFSTLSPIPALRRHVEDREPALSAALDAGGGDRSRLVDAARDLITRPSDGRVADPVAHFHLSNGARVESIRDHADPSPRGQRRSWGVMANYCYEPEALADRAQAYRRGEVAVGPHVP